MFFVMSLRVEKINELIKHYLNDIFLIHLSFKKGVFVTITKIDTSCDFRYTRASISVFPEKEFPYALKTLQKEIFFIQKKLNEKLQMKIFPKIKFKPDKTEVEAEKIEKLLKLI